MTFKRFQVILSTEIEREVIQMTITEMIEKLSAIRAMHGDLRVTIFDTLTEAEGYDYAQEDLWVDAEPTVGEVLDDDDRVIEKVVVIGE